MYIYDDWDSAKAQVSGYPGGACTKFNTLREALDYLGVDASYTRKASPTPENSDSDNVFLKAAAGYHPKNKNLSDAEAKGRKKEKAMKFCAVKVGRKTGVYIL